MRLERLRESQTAELTLSEGEARALEAIGRRLASRSRRWPQAREPDEEAVADRSVIHVSPSSNGRWRVRVSDAVGLISVGELQIEITPKIPLAHLLLLLGAGDYLPRVTLGRTSATADESLWPVVARWYLEAVEALLRSGLSQGYEGAQEFLRAVRGSISPLNTGRRFYAGRAEFDCRYEDFTTDTPLNRVLKAASRRLAGSSALRLSDRQRARLVSLKMEDVGLVRETDFKAAVARETLRYRDAIDLAVLILQDRGRSLLHGQESSWTFLIRTPEAVEAGVRSILRDALAPMWEVRKGRRQARGSTVTFNPDLVFGGSAIGDVKYQLASKDWQRLDLYQSLAFMTAFDTPLGIVIGFQLEPGPIPPVVTVEGRTARYIPWRATDGLSPEDAATDLVSSVRRCLLSSPRAVSAVA